MILRMMNSRNVEIYMIFLQDHRNWWIRFLEAVTIKIRMNKPTRIRCVTTSKDVGTNFKNYIIRSYTWLNCDQIRIAYKRRSYPGQVHPYIHQTSAAFSRYCIQPATRFGMKKYGLKTKICTYWEHLWTYFDVFYFILMF